MNNIVDLYTRENLFRFLNALIIMNIIIWLTASLRITDIC